MSSNKDTEAAPALPPVSVDFNKLHDQCKAGQKPEAAAKAAIFGATVPEERGEGKIAGAEPLETRAEGAVSPATAE